MVLSRDLIAKIPNSDLLKVMKYVKVKSIDKDGYLVLKRLALSFLFFYLKQTSIVCNTFLCKSINKSTLELVRKLNIESNAFHHGFYIEKIAHLMKGGEKLVLGFQDATVDLYQVGGGKYIDFELLKNICKVILNELKINLNIEIDAIKYLRDILENYLHKIAYNTIDYNRELRKERKKLNIYILRKDDIINALP